VDNNQVYEIHSDYFVSFVDFHFIMKFLFWDNVDNQEFRSVMEAK
jgi:hypothetical protein